tara:strand:+ start:3868 stop:4500 length:633 start_codon:yes stop_codon:yes gene_type:complete
MLSNWIQEKGILAKLLEKGIKILIKKECKNIGAINIDIYASSFQIIRGNIKKIYIIAKEINYKDLLFDEIELESNDVKNMFKINGRELNLRNDFIIKFKVSLSQNSLNKVLTSHSWHWIKQMISNEILNQGSLEDININNNQIFIKSSEDSRKLKSKEMINLKAKEGKLFLENNAHKKSIKIPIEDKIYIKNVDIKNNLINIYANSPISF